jgi:hypothetical protein
MVVNKTHMESGNDVGFFIPIKNSKSPEMHESDTTFLESLMSVNYLLEIVCMPFSEYLAVMLG